MKTLENIYNPKDNSFDLLRFTLAYAVLIYHSYILLGTGHDIFTNYFKNITLGTFAVGGFFALSGFFITASFLNTDNFISYLKKRLLRIIPAFLVSLLLIIFIIVPIASSQEINYFSLEKDTPLYFLLNSIFFHIFNYSWSVNGVFEFLPFPNSLNGSMWTLKHEFAAYLIMPLILVLAFKNRVGFLLTSLVIVILAILNVLFSYKIFNFPCCSMWVFSSNEYNSFILFFSFFLIGSNLYLFKDKVILSYRLVLVFIFLIFISNKYQGPTLIFLMLFLPYILIYVGSVFKYKFFTKYGDYSYGVYIYAFPLQQFLIYLYYENLTIGRFIFLASVITLIISILSWHLIEKNFLKMKRLKNAKN